jgi:hypothetical protein
MVVQGISVWHKQAAQQQNNSEKEKKKKKENVRYTKTRCSLYRKTKIPSYCNK